MRFLADTIKRKYERVDREASEDGRCLASQIENNRRYVILPTSSHAGPSRARKPIPHSSFTGPGTDSEKLNC